MGLFKVVSQCSHHHQTILGKCHIAYIPGEEGRVIGLSNFALVQLNNTILAILFCYRCK